MARQASKKKSPRQRSGNGRSASQKPEKYRFAQNVDGDETVAEREYRTYASSDPEEMTADADVLLDVPVVKVDSIHLKLSQLEAHVALKAQVFDLVKLNVGVDIQLGKLELDIKGVEAQALVKVRLDHVAAIVDRVMTTVDRNPDLVESLGQAIEDVGEGAGDALGESGEAVEEVGQGAGQAVGQIGEGAGEAVGQLGQGAGQAVGDVGEGAGQAAGGLVGQLGQTAGGAGQALGGLTGGGGQAQEGGQEDQPQSEEQQQGGDSGGGSPAEGVEGGELDEVLSGAQDAGAISGGQVAKVAAKAVAKEIGSAASDEAKDIGLAATRKVKELGERRRERRARKHNATPAAAKIADELGVDLDEVEGSGAEGRITVRDVRDSS
jgi:2-oxoacid dehydrogenase-like protein with E3 subunit-binding domain